MPPKLYVKGGRSFGGHFPGEAGVAVGFAFVGFGFFVPGGDYNPDWAIGFESGYLECLDDFLSGNPTSPAFNSRSTLQIHLAFSLICH